MQTTLAFLGLQWQFAEDRDRRDISRRQRNFGFISIVDRCAQHETLEFAVN